MDDLTAIGALFGNVGAPVALCAYTLFEINKNIKKLTNSVDRLESRLDKLETNFVEYMMRGGGKLERR